ncbi:hypothetical protein [Demequina salsinemoris]|uniref:hypothetical protein n=1 Tax=Demequina salsinemoris TaxID=577470 RepID=UPI000A4A99D6|nr:hypothetical protein [Demequina salsinemoris]
MTGTDTMTRAAAETEDVATPTADTVLTVTARTLAALGGLAMAAGMITAIATLASS